MGSRRRRSASAWRRRWAARVARGTFCKPTTRASGADTAPEAPACPHDARRQCPTSIPEAASPPLRRARDGRSGRHPRRDRYEFAVANDFLRRLEVPRAAETLARVPCAPWPRLAGTAPHPGRTTRGWTTGSTSSCSSSRRTAERRGRDGANSFAVFAMHPGIARTRVGDHGRPHRDRPSRQRSRTCARPAARTSRRCRSTSSPRPNRDRWVVRELA